LDGDELVLEAAAQPPAAIVEALSTNKAGIVEFLGSADNVWTAMEWKVFFDERAGTSQGA
jgi:hypothetical protein